MTNKNQKQAQESSMGNVCGCCCDRCFNCISMDEYQARLEKKKQDFIATLDKAPVAGLAVGDVVTFKNDYGVEFPNQIITGFEPNNEDLTKRFIYLDTHSYWFGAHLHQIIKTN